MRTDVVNLKRRTNQHSLMAEELTSRVLACVPKEEFYKFIKKLADRLDKIEDMRDWRRKEKEKEEIDFRFTQLEKKARIKESLKSEVKQVRKLQAKVSLLEGTSVKISDYNKEITNLIKGLSEARKIMATEKEVEDVKESMAELDKKTETAITDHNKKTEKSIADFSKKTETAITDHNKKTETSMAELDKKTETAITDHNKKTETSMAELDKKTEKSIADFSKKTEKNVEDAKTSMAELNKKTNNMIVSFVNNDVFEEKIQDIKDGLEDVRENAKEFAMKDKVAESHHTKAEMKVFFEKIEALTGRITEVDAGVDRLEEKILEKVEVLKGSIESKLDGMLKETKHGIESLEKKQSREIEAIQKQTSKTLNKIEDEFEHLKKNTLRSIEKRQTKEIKSIQKQTSSAVGKIEDEFEYFKKDSKDKIKSGLEELEKEKKNTRKKSADLDKEKKKIGRKTADLEKQKKKAKKRI